MPKDNVQQLAQIEESIRGGFLRSQFEWAVHQCNTCIYIGLCRGHSTGCAAADAAATFRQRGSAQFFGRRVDCGVVKTAATILTMYLALFFGGGVFISAYENLPLSSCLYEASSAVGTVGLTLDITPQLHISSQIVLIVLTYLGRVGGLTLIYTTVSSKKIGNAKLPQERITIG